MDQRAYSSKDFKESVATQRIGPSDEPGSIMYQEATTKGSMRYFRN